MKVEPIENGLIVVAETAFEEDYLRSLFTLNQNRRVTFNPDSAALKVIAQGTEITSETK